MRFALLSQHRQSNKSTTSVRTGQQHRNSISWWLCLKVFWCFSHQYSKLTASNVISKFSERVYIIYFISHKTWVNFVHRQKTTVTTRSLTVNKNRNEAVHIKKQWIKPWQTHRVNETQTNPHSLTKQLNDGNHRKHLV